MSGATDKARFFLEQSIPELQEYERKGLFTKQEITAITKRRSDFEHKINARGSHPSDYAQYAEFEMNLESLRKKRTQRMGVKFAGHSGQRRIFFILDRGTRKFHGDIGLWMQYIEFARKEKANKKLTQILTSVLRMHPTKPELWIYAARYAMDAQADITSARSYMQRGLRFCKSSRLIWLEYAKLEMIYVAKIAARRKILGLDMDRSEKQELLKAVEDPNADMIALPAITEEDINPTVPKDAAVDEQALQNLASAPALTGAIPIAVFDAAMKQFQDEEKLGEQYFDMFAEFDRVPSIRNILRHVVDHLTKTKPTATATYTCSFKLPLVGIDPSSAEFPPAVGQSLERIKASFQESPANRGDTAAKAIAFILPFIRSEDLDSNVRKALLASLRQFGRTLEEAKKGADSDGAAFADLASALQREGRIDDARLLVAHGLKQYSSNEKLVQLQASLAG